MALFFDPDFDHRGLRVPGDVGEGFLEEQKEVVPEIERQLLRKDCSLAIHPVIHAAQDGAGKSFVRNTRSCKVSKAGLISQMMSRIELEVCTAIR